MRDKFRIHCAEKSVHDQGRWPSFHACSRKGVVFRDGKYWCRQHDPAAVEARKRAAMERSRAKMDRWSEEACGPAAIRVLREIADGCPKPREAAAKFLRRLER